jgi:hypothetical protein
VVLLSGQLLAQEPPAERLDDPMTRSTSTEIAR